MIRNKASPTNKMRSDWKVVTNQEEMESAAAWTKYKGSFMWLLNGMLLISIDVDRITFRKKFTKVKKTFLKMSSKK